MIKKIKFKHYANDYEVNFSKGVNLIVGPKGGGKSSLLNLLASFEAGQISKKVSDLFTGKAKKDNSDVVDIIVTGVDYTSGDSQSIESLNKILDKAAKEKFDENMNILSQDDRYKTALDDSKQLLKDKKEFVEKIVAQSEEIRTMKNDMNRLKELLTSYTDLYSNSLHWLTILKVTKNTESSDMFLKLDYKSDEVIKLKNDYKNESSRMNIEIINAISKMKDFVNKFYVNNEYDISQGDKKDDKKMMETMIESFTKNAEQLNKITDNRNEILLKWSELSEAFGHNYYQTVEEIKEKDFGKKGVERFIAQSLNHMKAAGNSLNKFMKLFDKIMSDSYILPIDKIEPHGLLNFRLSGEIQFDDEEIITLLKSYLYSSNTKTDSMKWVEQAIKKGYPDKSHNSFEKAIIKILTKKVEITSGGKQYSTMSPGEKSILGMKYKLDNSNKNILYLDQPEDNLDNHTIANEVLEMLQEKKKSGKQIFIVTHNSNIGVLLNPETVILADFSDKDHPYKVNKDIDLSDNPKAFFLEGGMDKLNKRYETLREETHE